MKPDVTYSTYLHLDAILNAQEPRSDEQEHDEMLFIIIHQVYELWFKQMLHEIDYAAQLFRTGDTARALQTLRRLLTILKTVVAQIDVLETMTPLEFNAFRSYLDSASGFQSAQFRELEFVLGYKRPNILRAFTEDTAAREKLQARFDAPTLWDAFLVYVANAGYDVPDALLNRDVTQSIGPSEAFQQTLIHIYRTDPDLTRVCERLIDMDEGMQEWRYRHIKMVERTIGTKTGTGGSTGVKYLHTTMQPFFADLWAIRTAL